ncbi:MAG: DUF2254 domain-containing protein [bacterium]
MFDRLRPRLRARWQSLLDGLWFVPAVMIAGAIALAIALIELSDVVDRATLVTFPRLFGANAASSRSMLATIAGAMMTVAGVTFSITVVAVTQASSQYTPRLLRNFMRDRPSQIALGTLTGVFVYCLVVLRTIRDGDDLRFIPSLAVLGAMLLALVAIGVLIYFIHHIAGALQASGILARVGGESVAAIDRLFPDGVGEEAPDTARPELDEITWHVVASPRSGYLTGVDADGLIVFADSHDTIVRMDHGVGDFVVAGTPLAGVATAPAVDADSVADVAELFAISQYRTIDQDAAFGIRQMVDMALRALSPGVNDTTTAVTCVHHLIPVLVRLADRRIENRFRTHAGRLRLIAEGASFDRLVWQAIDQIRRNAGGNADVLAELLECLATVIACTQDPRRRTVLRDHAELVRETADRSIDGPPANRVQVDAAFAAVQRALAAPARVISPMND